MTTLLSGTVVVCTACGHRALSKATGAAQPGQGAGDFHECPALGIIAPLHPEGLNVKVEKVEREDYVASESLRYDNDGRPIMSIVTTRDDGQDAVVFAPCAKARFET